MSEEIEELIPLYALGAATPEEMARVDAYVASNPEARRSLDEAIAAVDEIGFSAEPEMPDPAIRANVLAYARQNPRKTAERVKTPPVSDEAVESRRPVPSSPARRPAADSPSWWQRLRQSWAFPALAGGLAVLALLLLVWNMNLRAANEALQGQIIAMQEQILAQEEVLALLPGGSTHAVSGTESQPEAHGQLLISADGRTAILLARNLSPLAADETYQLWYIAGDSPVSQGIFSVDEQGDGRLRVQSEQPPDAFDAIGVSIEPAPGSTQPTGDIVLFGEVGAGESG